MSKTRHAFAARLVLVLLAALFCCGAQAANTSLHSWNVDANGDWDMSANWSGGLADNKSHEALFGTVITGDRVITMRSGSFLAGNLSFDSTFQYRLVNATASTTSGNSLTLQEKNFADAFDQNGSGTVIIDVPVVLVGSDTLWGGTGSGQVTVNGQISGSVGITKSEGTWALVLTGANTYTGDTVINAGTISIGADSALGAVPGSVNATSLTLDGGTLTTTSSFTLNANRGLTLGAGAGTVSVASGTTLTYNGIIAGSSTADALIKTGAGTLVLGGLNTYQGATTINAGIVSISADSGLGTIPAVVTAASVTLDGGTLASTATFTLNSKRGITLGTGAGTISVGTGSTLTYNGIIAGPSTSDSLIKTGAGTLTLGGNDTYLGNTTINAGTLAITDRRALGAGGGTLTINGATANLTLGYNDNANNALFNGITIQDGSITRTASANLRSGILDSSKTLTVTGNATLLDQGGDSTGGYFAVDGLVTVQSGTLTLKAASANDEVRLTQQLTIGAGAAVTVDAATLGVVSFGSGSAITIEGQGTAASQSTFNVNAGATYNSATTINLNGSGTGGLKVSGSQSLVDAFLTSDRIQNHLTASGGTLTVAYSDPNLTANFSKAPASGSIAKIGFYVPSGSTTTFGTVANDMQNWGGLVVDGPTGGSAANAIFALAKDQNLVGNGAALTTLDLLGGDLQLAGGNPFGGKTLTISGNATMSGGIIDGGPGGGSRGLLVVGGDLVVGGTSFGTTGHGLISITMTPAHNATTYIRPLNSGVDTAMVGSINVLKIQAADSTGTVRIDSHMTTITASELHISTGTLLLGKNNQIASTTGLIFDGAGGTLNLNGFSQNFATLTMTASSHLDFGAGSTGTFDLGTATTLTGTLTIDNWNAGATLTSDSALTSAQLGTIRFFDPYGPGSGTFAARFDPNNSLNIIPVPVPEPGPTAALILIGLLLTYRERKFFLRLASSARRVLP